MSGEASLVDSLQKHFLQTVKLAVAIAVLRTKPRHLSAREYAEQLNGLCFRRSLRWREKYESAERKLLVSRQENLLSRVPPSPPGQQAGDVDGMVYPTPPLSEKTFTPVPDLLEASLTNHTNFLQSTLHLKNVSSLLKNQFELDELTKKTVEDSLHIIKTTILKQELYTLTKRCIGYSIKCIVEMAESSHSKKLISLVQKELNEIFQEFIKRMILSDDASQIEKQEYLHLFLHLIHSRVMQEKLLDTLMQKLHEFSSYLRKITSSPCNLDPALFENNFYLISFMEICLQKIMESPTVFPSVMFIEQLKERLEDSLLHLVDVFPMFAHSVWKLAEVAERVLVEQCSQQHIS